MDQSSVPVDPVCSACPVISTWYQAWLNTQEITMPAITPERRPRTPERFLRTPQRSTRTPDRWVWTPIRRARSCSESRDSRSSSPVSRSSSVEFPTQDGSPVNFTAAMDPDIKRVFFLMTRTMTVTVRRSQQLDTRSSDKLWLRQRDHLKSTLLRQSERPERLCWTWVIRRWLTESRGWTSRLFRTRWFLRHV